MVNVRGPTSFEFLLTVLMVSSVQACQCLHLLEDDIQLDHTLAVDVIPFTAHQIRSLFATVVSTCFQSNPLHSWNKYKDNMAQNILHRVRTTTVNPELEFNTEVHNETLVYIEDL